MSSDHWFDNIGRPLPLDACPSLLLFLLFSPRNYHEEPGYPSFWDKNLFQPVKNTNYKQEFVEDSISRPEASAEASASAEGDYPSFWDKICATVRTAIARHSLPIYSHELLFASEKTPQQNTAKIQISPWANKCLQLRTHSLMVRKFRGGTKKVEFLGNGGVIYSGRVYSRAVILIWPRSNRNDIQCQSRGGRAVLTSQSSDVAGASDNAVTAPGRYYDQQCK